MRETGGDNRTRLLLSGSSLPVMHRLFGAAAPLHGLPTWTHPPPADFRQSARFWHIDDPRLALLVHAVVAEPPPTGHYVRGRRPQQGGRLRRLGLPNRGVNVRGAPSPHGGVPDG
ncbi:hypothetical protein GCM10023238_25210 [Streptomyces heliomycini]